MDAACWWRSFLLVALFLAGGPDPMPRLHAAGIPFAVSAPYQSSLTGAGASFHPVFSADGRRLAFLSWANNLVTNDDAAPFLDVFLRDLDSDITILLSVNAGGAGGGDGNSFDPSLSLDGQRVAFASDAENLVLNDTNRATDVFVREVTSGQTRLVSAVFNGEGGAVGETPFKNQTLSGKPLLSKDGRSVVFESNATNLTDLPDDNHATDIFARDLANDITFLVSVNASGSGPGNARSHSAVISDDGLLVGFISQATDLVPGATNAVDKVFVRNLSNQETIWVNAPEAVWAADGGGLESTAAAYDPVLTGDGRFIAFKVGGRAIIRHDLEGGNEPSAWIGREIPVGQERLSISSDGRFVGMDSPSFVGQGMLLSDALYRLDFLNLEPVLFERDGALGASTVTNLVPKLEWVSDVADTNGNRRSYPFLMTDDGSGFLFLSDLAALPFGQSNGVAQIYFRDMATEALGVVSTNANGEAGPDLSISLPALTRDGGWTAFASADGTLTPTDLNGVEDVFLRDLRKGELRLVSERHPDLPERTGRSLATLGLQSVSGNGRWVALASLDSTLVPDDTNIVQDLFLADIVAGTMQPISPAEPASPGPSVPSFWLESPMLDLGGRHCIYLRKRKETEFGATWLYELYWRDLETATERLVRSGIYVAEVYGGFFHPTLSGDGLIVVFQSKENAHNLVPELAFEDDFITTADIFLWNAATTNQAFELVSLRADGRGAGNKESIHPVLSPDQNWVVYQSLATNLVTPLTRGLHYQLYARNLAAHTNVLLSYSTNGLELDEDVNAAVFSADSRHIAFQSVPSHTIYLHELLAPEEPPLPNREICTGCSDPSLSADGRLLAFATQPTPERPGQIYVRDVASGENELISGNYGDGGDGDGDSTGPKISYDGRFVVFTSVASNLVKEDRNQAKDIFVRDRWLGLTVALSANLGGDGTAREASNHPVLSADGHVVVFQSFGDNLVSGDYNFTRDVFTVRLGGKDSDGDGMEDDWEMAYFGTISRDGNGDFDEDGSPDREEFRAGTDPTDDQSVFAVLRITQGLVDDFQVAKTKLVWRSRPGATYQVQYRDGLEDGNWHDLPEALTASGPTSTMEDGAPAGPDSSKRFYRVRLVD